MPQIVVQDLEKSFRVAERRAGLWGAVRSLAHRRYREVRALHGLEFFGRNGRADRLHRSERRRQVDHHQDSLRHPDAHGGTLRSGFPGALARPGAPCRAHRRGLRPAHAALVGPAGGRVVRSLARHLRDAARQHAASLEELAALLDLEPLFDTPVRQLSLGQRARCDLAASLLHAPRILFLDEPTIGLDAVSRLAIRDFVRRLNAERGVTVLLTSHDMGDIEALCERVMVVNGGALLLDGPVAALRGVRGGQRRVTVVFEPGEAPASEDMARARLDGGRYTFDVDANAPAFVANLTARYRIRDLIVEHPPIKEIVRDLYRGAHERAPELPLERKRREC